MLRVRWRVLWLTVAMAALVGCATGPTRAGRERDRCRVTSPAAEQVALFYIFCYNSP
jgi:hypothetical protein